MTENNLQKLFQSEIKIQPDYLNRGLQVYILNHSKKEICTDVVWESMEDEPEIHHPNRKLVFPNEQAQMMMDELWNSGVRPSGQISSQGQLKALEGHLNDMRRIVSKELDIELLK